MSKYGTRWLHHCMCRSEKEVLTDHESITPSEQTQCQVHHTFEKRERVARGNPKHCCRTLESRVKKHFVTEKEFSGLQQVQGNYEPPVRLFNPEIAVNSLLGEKRAHELAEAESERLMQECKRVEIVNTCLRQFQRQAL